MPLNLTNISAAKSKQTANHPPRCPRSSFCWAHLMPRYVFSFGEYIQLLTFEISGPINPELTPRQVIKVYGQWTQAQWPKWVLYPTYTFVYSWPSLATMGRWMKISSLAVHFHALTLFVIELYRRTFGNYSWSSSAACVLPRASV